MRWYHILLMGVLTFCWIWALPLLLVGFFFSIPACLAILPACILISIGFQWKCHGRLMSSSWLRRMISKIPWHQWFPCNVLDVPTTPSILSVHPHGVLCCGAIAGIHLVPESQTLFCVAPILFYVPVLGWIARLLGCIPADYNSMKSAITQGYPLLVVPGGVPELVMAERCDDTAFFIEKRFGFLKLAIETQVPLFPIFSKGETSTYRLVKAPLLEWRVWLSWKLNVPVVFPWFRGWYNLWLPRRVPIKLVYGSFLKTQIKYSRESLQAFKKHYIKELRRTII